jgi:hypothetical protein
LAYAAYHGFCLFILCYMPMNTFKEKSLF